MGRKEGHFEREGGRDTRVGRHAGAQISGREGNSHIRPQPTLSVSPASRAEQGSPGMGPRNF